MIEKNVKPEQNIPVVTVFVCTTCRNAEGSADRPVPGELLAAATKKHAQGTTIDVRETKCLANCKRRLSAAIHKQNSWTYIFGDLTPDNFRDLVQAARLYEASFCDDLPWNDLPDVLKRGVIARVPSA